MTTDEIAELPFERLIAVHQLEREVARLLSDERVPESVKELIRAQALSENLLPEGEVSPC